MKACTAIADAVDAGAPLGAAAEQVIAALGDENKDVSGMALYILQTEAERNPSGGTVDALRTAMTSDAVAVRRNAAFLLAGFLARLEDGAGVAALLADADPVVLAGVLKALADGAIPRARTDAVVAAVVPLLAHAELNVRKEATWVLYLLATAGTAIDAAVPALEGMLDDAATQGNAAIALSYALHTTNQGSRADASYERASGPIQMGTAWGAADAALRSEDLPALKKLFSSENDNVRRGLGGLLNYAQKRRRDISLAGTAFNELEREHPDDALLHARIYGVLDIVKRGPTS
ncbi:MAG: hypothetical protein H0T46_04380 [Deltaproteobacteria bacterium]|nr:hypothetical protein [Deltaproteobacteria bacterium]